MGPITKRSLRSTLGIGQTIKGIPLTEPESESIIKAIIASRQTTEFRFRSMVPLRYEFSYPRIFGGSISLLAYPPETLAAEKIETILSRGTANTRMKDFYDAALLFERKEFLNPDNLKKALLATTARRRTDWMMKDMDSIIESLNDSGTMEKRWGGSFQKTYAYASSFSWASVMDSLRKLCLIALGQIHGN